MTDIRNLDVNPPAVSLPVRLSPEQLDAFARDGLLYLPAFFSAHEMQPAQRLVAHSMTLRDNSVEVIASTGVGAKLFGWSGNTNDMLGLYVRIARVIEVAEDLLGSERVYHWHSKLSMKPPHSDGKWDWHQDYGSWYREGCLRPEMLTITIAVDACDDTNGCMKLVRGSHRLGRIHHGPLGASQGADPDVVEHALRELEPVECALDAGDAVVFHGNTLHASGANRSERPRTLLHVSYNTVRNAPRKGMRNHHCTPLSKAPDDVLTEAPRLPDIDLVALGRHRDGWYVDRATGSNVYGYTVQR